MDNNYTSSVTAGQSSESTILVRRRNTDVPVFPTEQSKSEALMNRYNWTIRQPLQTPSPVVEHEPIVVHSVPPFVSDFVRSVAEIEGVRCIVAEDAADEQTVHFTTFAQPVTDHLREAVYAVEQKVIEDYPDVIFDFHLRDASRTITGTPVLVPGQRFFAVWGSLDDEPRRPSEAGEE